MLLPFIIFSYQEKYKIFALAIFSVILRLLLSLELAFFKNLIPQNEAPVNMLNIMLYAMQIIPFLVIIRVSFEFIKASDLVEKKLINMNLELKEAQEMLVQSAKLSALGELSANIAHEVQNPLSVVSLNAERILDVEAGARSGGASIKESALKILSTTHRLSSIVSDILAIARDSSKDQFQYVSAEDLIEKVETIALSRLRNSQIELTKSIQTECLIWCQPSQIMQVLINLINNSVDAISELKEKWIHIRCNKTATHIEIAITDSGPGIPLEVAEKMMQPFFTTKPANKGTGLGLSLAKKIVERHKGEFIYDPSSANTRFVIRLPLA